MILLLDIGNTHTHVGLADGETITKHGDIPTAAWFKGDACSRKIARLAPLHRLRGVAVCSVVPRATRAASPFLRGLSVQRWELKSATAGSLAIDYPKPETIGADRLANAIAARRYFGWPVVVVDFGTAVTFDVVDHRGAYVGGIIAPGLAAMTTYLHEKTALLPRIKIADPDTPVGKSTVQAMQIGAVHGYRGMIRELIHELKKYLGCRKLPVVATGGYAELIAAKLPLITAVRPDLTLEGLRLGWQEHFGR